MTIVASAPGKIVLAGEYAVLDGAPALVMAVQRRVAVSLEARDGARCTVAAPGWSEATGSFELTADGPAWREPVDPGLALTAHVLDAFFREAGAGCRAFHLDADSTSLTEMTAGGRIKLGLGSSAAVTVALWQALSYHAAMHQPRPKPDLGRLVDIHTGFQGNRGSGLDVAASLVGGFIEYVRSPNPRARRVRFPPGVDLCFVWSGRQAATGAFLARIQQWRDRDPAGFAAALAPLTRIAENAAASVRDGDGDAFLACLDAYAPALESLGTGAGADILSEPHRRLGWIARRTGVVYKPCGAGGGDIGAGLSRDAEALARFRSAAVSEGFRPLSLNVDQNGVQARSGN